MEELYQQWKQDEEANFEGWDFSYLKNRWLEEQPPWDYEGKAKELVSQSTAVLDMGTGGGEKFAMLAPFPEHTIAIEAYKPNVSVARKRLESLGVKVIEANESYELPFSDGEFDLILNRHSAFKSSELFRILKVGGVFLTQQVSGENLNDMIVEFNAIPKYKDWILERIQQQLKDAGFEIEEVQKWTGKMHFNDVGAIVYFLRAIPWIVEGFSVDGHLPFLQKLQKKLEDTGKLIFTQKRFLIRVGKPHLKT
ncbi:MAG: class I SAM-dependent methyltransferase [Patescibacteria group bacterium]